MNGKNLLINLLFYLPDAALAVVVLSSEFWDDPHAIQIFLVYLLYLFLRIIIHVYFYFSQIVQSKNYIIKLIASFTKGKYAVAGREGFSNSLFSDVISNIFEAGRYFENLVGTQNDEIEKFRELYYNIVLTANSYFLVLDSKNEIIFSNKSFNSAFNFTNDELMQMRFSDAFYITAGRLIDAIENVRVHGESIILRQVRLLSRKKISIIADIKISRITVQGEYQLILVIDDITSKCRKDYQISLISQISESIQKDSEIDRILFGILTSVTSGSGLGFNRAMLFLHNPETHKLYGKIAVGPDSFEEAIQIWGSVQNDDRTLLQSIEAPFINLNKGINFYRQVTEKSFSVDEDTIFTRAFHERKSIHIYDSYNDPRVNEEIRKFMDVAEFVIVPLSAGNKSIGLVIADNKYNKAPIYNDHLELLSIFAVQAALSLDSFNSLDSVKQQMEKIQSRQDAIVESEKMAAVGRIAAHIAHEIRNPLVTVGGYARRILQLLKKPMKTTEPVEKCANVILQESERLEKILSNVMDFSRPSPLIKEYNSLNDVVTDTCSLLNNVFQEKKISVTLNLSKKLPLVKSDFNQLKQVILNLIQNAMDVTPAGGEINIETSRESDKLVIRVRDTGSGIDEDNLAKIFEPFFTSKVTGVGLGLAVCKKIISDHNGDIYVRNREDRQGAEFTIELPAPT